MRSKLVSQIYTLGFWPTSRLAQARTEGVRLRELAKFAASTQSTHAETLSYVIKYRVINYCREERREKIVQQRDTLPPRCEYVTSHMPRSYIQVCVVPSFATPTAYGR